jgi:hypothetical protein
MCIPHPSLLTKQRGNRTVTAPVPATTIVSFLAVSETSRYDEADEEETGDDDDVQWESTCAALAPHLPPPCSSKNKKPQVLANVTGDCERARAGFGSCPACASRARRWSWLLASTPPAALHLAGRPRPRHYLSSAPGCSTLRSSRCHLHRHFYAP